MEQEEMRRIPSCPLSAQCLRFVDALDTFAPIDEDPHDQELIEQLREHIPSCPSCSAAIAQARRLRSQQRTALHAILLEGEQQVPSTISQVQTAIRHEAQKRPQPDANDVRRFRRQDSNISIIPGLSKRGPGRTASSASRPEKAWLRNIAAVAVVAIIILSAIGLFTHRLLPSTGSGGPNKKTVALSPTPGHPSSPTTSSSPTPASSPAATPSPATTLPYGGWDFSMIAVPSSDGSQLTIENYNFASGTHTTLGSQPIPANATFDGISPDGKDLLYQFSSSGHTYYARLLTPLANTGFFFELTDQNAGNAIWMPDSQHVLIATNNTGILEVDTLTGQSSPFLSPLNGYTLVSYHNGYLYYRNGQFLYRINLTTRVVQTVISMHGINPNVWFSPDGSLIYFASAPSASNMGLYSVNVDGSNQQLLRSAGEPIGFAADNSLLFMRLVNGQFQVVKLGATPQQDQVLLANAAPGAISLCPARMNVPNQICDNFIAMAPYGHALIVQGTGADGTYHVWSDDLATNKQTELYPSPNNRTAVQLPGWDTIPVP